MSKDNKKVVHAAGADLVARRHNVLITAKHRMSMQAQRLFLYVVSLIKDEHDEETEYEFPVNELASAIGIDRSRLYKNMVDVLEEVAACMVELPALDGDGKIIDNSIIRVGLIKNRQRVRLTGNKETRLAGAISVSLYKELLPYVRELKVRFTEVELKYAFRLPSGYSLRLYDLLKVRAFMRQPWRIERDELRGLLGIKPDEYALWGDFRRYVLEKAQKDIGMHTDLAFEIDYIATGRTVTELVFRLRQEGGAEVEILPGTDKHRALKALVDLGLKEKDADRVISEWWDEDADLVRWHASEARKMKAAGKIDNAVGWFLTGLKRDFRPQRSLFAEMRRKAAESRDSRDEERLQLPGTSLQAKLESLYDRLGGGGADRTDTA